MLPFYLTPPPNRMIHQRYSIINIAAQQPSQMEELDEDEDETERKNNKYVNVVFAMRMRGGCVHFIV